MTKVKNGLTWENTMPMYIEILTSNRTSDEQKKIATEELMRLAKLVDGINGKKITK